MVTASDVSILDASPFFSDDPELARQALRSLAHEQEELAASLEDSLLSNARRSSLISDLRALSWLHRRWVRVAQELGALSPPELAEARRGFAEPIIRACQKQTAALMGRFRSNDCSPTETCRLANAWITVIRLRKRLQGDLDRASDEK
jgi:hypothetical protein